MTDRFPFPQKPAYKVLFGLYLFLILYLCRVSQVSYYLLGFYKAQFFSLGITLAALAVFLIYQRRHLLQIVLNYRVLLALLFAAAILIPMCIKRDWQMMYFSILLSILLGVFFSYFVTCAQAGKGFCIVMAVLAVYSLAAFALRPLADRGILTPPVFANAYGGEFYNYILAFVPKTMVRDRNFGIFREPGVYQFFLITALYLNNYEVEWKKPWQLWLVNGILAATMVSTFATGGVAEMGLLAIVLFFDKKWYRDKRICAVAVGLILCVAVIAGVSIARKNVLYWEVYDMAIGKFVNGQDSSVERMDAVVTDISIFLHHPIFGAKIAEVLYATANNTTSTLILFSAFGIPAALLHIACWVALVWRKERKMWVNLALVVILFMSFNTQNLIADVFLWLFPVMALVERLMKRG